jgi:DNA replicative helicase MCM subunit Mcm2 (Cdc46/Mcm family)
MNAKDITTGDSNILIVGDSGTFKTGFLATIPGIFIYDFDKGMATARGKDVEYETFRDAPKSANISQGARGRGGLYRWAEGWPAFIKHLNGLGERIDKGTGPKAIGLDSLTFLSEMAMNHVLSGQKEAIIHQGSYGAQQQYIKTVLGELTAWPIRVIATAHIQRSQNDLTMIEEKLPLLTGKLAGLIGAFFDEVYFTDANGQKFTFLTHSTPSMRQAKSRWNVPNNTPMDWKELVKYLPEPVVK